MPVVLFLDCFFTFFKALILKALNENIDHLNSYFHFSSEFRPSIFIIEHYKIIFSEDIIFLNINRNLKLLFELNFIFKLRFYLVFHRNQYYLLDI